MSELRKSSKTACLILGVSCLVAAGCLAFPSFAWFAKAKTTAEADSISGSSTSAYFRGKGTKENPYLIESAKQLYYFNWLQDLGYFNESKEDGNVDQIYFSLESDLDMKGYVLPPAGTTTNPFLGNFKGNDHVIKNLCISNSLKDVTEKPSNAKDDDKDGLLDDAEIVGFFGIVGKWTGEEKIDTTINSVSGLYFDKLEITSQANKTLAGLLAGYVNGSMSDCAVRSGNITYVSGAKPLQNNVFGTENDKLSKYSLIGDYNSENFEWKGKPSQGAGNDWGSSIDMMTLNRRMNYISAVSTFSVNTGSRYNVENSTYGYGGITSSAREMYWNNTTTTYWYVKDGTFLPLSINTDAAFSGNEITVTPSGISTQYHTTSYYQTHTSEFDLISSNNSGYLVGRTNDKGNFGDVRTRLQTVSSGLGNSSVTSPYDGNIKVYTIDTASGKNTAELYQKQGGIIKTDNASNYGFTRFNAVMENFDKFMNGYEVVHGFHMVKVEVTDSSNWDSPTFDVKILGKKYTNYQFVKGCLNFTVAKKGYITTLMGSCYGQTGNNTMFDLFSIDRDSNNRIKSVTRIKKIYKDSDGNISYDPSNTAGLTLVFDFDNVTGTNVFGSDNVNKAYYFELPVNPGDYAIGKSADEYMGYLMYLDIGANASGDSGDTGGTPDIDFTYYSSGTTLAKLSDAGYQKSDVVFSISGEPSPTTFYFWRKDAAFGVSYFIEPSGCTITPIGTGTNSNPGSKDDYETSGA